MNRSVLKSYAPKARLDFIQAVTDRAAFFGLTSQRVEPMQESGDVVIIGGRAFPETVARQRRSLEARMQRQSFDQVMDSMAYTWFNRFVALRYMELHGYLDHGYRVLSHPEGKATPEIVENAEHVTLPGLDAQEVVNLKLDGTKEPELYRLLLVAQCNALHEALPFLFEKIADDTELLLPDNLLHSDSVIRKLVNEIGEADWQQVEIIGWLYQFYISDKKDEVIGKVVKSEDIPAATQLFTPNWIVKYLVQNTLGRQWLATYPDSPIRQQMEYYIEPAEQTDEVKGQLADITPKRLDPETLTLLDPACGSGHILVEAYDLFKAIYQERGYRSKDIPRLILQKNLFGLEIDDRAAQLAAFVLLMKARADDRRIFADRIQPHVVSIQESKGLENLLRPESSEPKGAGELPFANSDLIPQTEKQLTLTKPNQESPLAVVEPCLRELIRLFEDGKTFGSLLCVPPELAAQLPAARQSIETMIAKGQLWEHRAAMLFFPLVKQAELLARSYDAVVTNPPYMGNKSLNPILREFAKENYPESKSDLFAIFVERLLSIVIDHGNLGLMTPFTWMFISSYEHLRRLLLSHNAITSLIQPEYHAFFESAYVPICAFTAVRSPIRFTGDFIKLTDFYGEELQSVKALEAIRDRSCSWRHKLEARKLEIIPGAPLAYWLSARSLAAFQRFSSFGKYFDIKAGIMTGNDPQFIREWHEVSITKIELAALPLSDGRHELSKKWYPINRGGDERKWFGNNGPVINLESNGRDIKNSGGNYRLRDSIYYFREGITWGRIGSSRLSARFSPVGCVFGDAGTTAYCESKDSLLIGLATLLSCTSAHFLQAISPTLNFQVYHVAAIPTPSPQAWPPDVLSKLTSNAQRAVQLAEDDWNGTEISWNFSAHSLLDARYHASSTQLSFEAWATASAARISELQQIEQENNTHFLRMYELEDELSPSVPSEQITLAGAERTKDVRALASFALGCMMGRYSLDKGGLVYAHSRNEGFDPNQYRTFPADSDGIIPMTELAWFNDDASERFVEFISKAWPRDHLEDNLKFIADSLGPNRDENPRDTIRRYFSTTFYKDHLSTYEKRPIYWLFSSGKQRAFQALVYLHRYHEGTLSRMRTEYVIPLQGKISHRIEQLAGDIAAATSTSHRRKLEKEKETLAKQSAELTTFDEKLHHYADQRITLDLDDGVKVNYGKFGDLLAEVKTVTGGTEA